jgi:UDPglucose 6-dehydrogenase
LEIIRGLQNRGATVKAYDPKADYSELSAGSQFEICPDAFAAATDCDALIVLTDWEEFRDLDFVRLGSVMHRRLLIDVRNFLNGPNLVNLGFEYFGIGRGQFAAVRRQSLCA